MLNNSRLTEKSAEVQIIDTIEKSKNRLFEEIVTVLFVTAGLVLYLLNYSSFLPLLILVFGSLWNFFTKSNHFMACVFGLVVCSLYTFVAVENGLFAHAFLHIMFYFPMQLIFFYNERKNTNIDIQKDKSLGVIPSLLVLTSAIAMFVFVGLVSRQIDNQNLPFADAFSAVLLAVSVFMVTCKFKEYWLIRFFATICAGLLWLFVGITVGWSNGAGSMILLFGMYFVVDVYSFAKWSLADLKRKKVYKSNKVVSSEVARRIARFDERNENKKNKEYPKVGRSKIG